jgi:septum site-determining protein MinC
MRSQVKINLTNDNLIIKLNEEADHKQIIESLKKKVVELKKIYKDSKTPILVTGKNLKENERVEIKNIIQEKLDVKISFDAPQELGLHGIKKSFSQEIESSQTKFHRGAVRSGQRIEYEGSIVILGDVNGGAEVIAGDNVVVLGVLRGLAHAGARGNKKAIIAAASIDCKQIRIADIIKEIEDEKDEDGNVIASSRKTYAYVEEDKLILE